MVENPECTLLIPVYNEGRRLLATLMAFKKIDRFNKIIVVDDGSTDQAVDIAKKLFDEVTILRLLENRGKTEAVRAGLKLVTTEYILLADADLRHINPDEFATGMNWFFGSTTKMLLFRRVKDFSHVFTGERILKTDLLRKMLDEARSCTGFQLEAAMNQYCLNHGLECRWWPVSSKNTYKILKEGLSGWLEDLKTIQLIISYVGIGNYFKQLWGLAKPAHPSRG